MKKKAISAILGTTIALAIVFTIFIPLFIYVQSLQTIFMQEANRRLQYELERIHEKLEVHLSITPPDSEGRRYPFIILYNPGTLTVSIPTIYIESNMQPLNSISTQYSIAPGERIIDILSSLPFLQGEPEIRRLKVVTLRGNSFISNDIGPANLPYYLIVTVSNMSFGHKYELNVDTITQYGCVLVNEFSELCGSRKSVIIIPQSFNDAVRTVAFKVAPGEYRVSVIDLVDGSQLKVERFIEVYDDVILNLRLIEKFEIPKTAPLRVNAIHKNLTLIVRESMGMITIPYMISLENLAEPLRDIKVIMIINEDTQSPLEYQIGKLYPGQMYLGHFTFNMPENVPTKINYRIKITEAKGMLSERLYGGESEYKIFDPEDEGKIDVCVIEEVNVKIIIDNQEIPKEISYVRCDPRDDPNSEKGD